MEYFIILICILIISIYLEVKYRIYLHDTLRERFEILLLLITVGVILDSWEVFRETWKYNDHKLLGITIGILPLEEYLFSLVIPYFCITVYKLFTKKNAKS